MFHFRITDSGYSVGGAIVLFLPVQSQHLLHVFSCVAQPRHFVLSAQFALAVQPVVEQAFAGNYYLRELQSQIVLPLGFLVGVDFFQRGVQRLHELFHAVRHLGELYQPLVAALGVFIHEDGGGGIV